MTALSEAELRQAFATLFQTTTDFGDFELIPVEAAQRVYARGFAPAIASRLDIFGLMGDGSTIATWQEPGNVGPSRPVVLLGSEGTMGVFASSFAEFLSLLPYGTGYIDEILFYFESERDSPGRYAQKFTSAYAREVLAATAEEYSEHHLYMDWLTHTAQLAIAPDPAAVMARAYQAHENFEQWLGDY
ncbi:hypothetical protein Q5H93_03455 [Hymenobacter sp. ASUV-10]|uniref:SMI1/KNR4 family protein n=1 Tax=Hymenobacter aranciens TaxID=3063996 RepID=A0ABT9B7J9_9BACT|nr:hypothetical protein [Hymenobacter sp. ASUV-10]MDO7873775.1 hypothetical protein [Hymenobacter sp. ASUV-10]